MGTTEPEAYGPTHNPWDLGRSPGGSSGGSGAAVAAGFVQVAHANDIAGSIRIPASQCGLVGLKPSTGRVNVTPGPAGAMLSEGVITRTMRDTAKVVDGLTLDQTAPGLAGEVGRDPGGLRIGLCLTAFTGADVDEGCLAAARDAAALLEALDHSVDEAWPAALYEPDLLALRDEAGGRADRQDRRRMVAATRPSDRRRRCRTDLVASDLHGASALRRRDQACARARAAARPRGPQLVGQLRSAAHADDGGARPTTRRVQAGVRSRARQRVHSGVQRDRATRGVPPPWLAGGRPAAVACSSSRPMDATTCSSASDRSWKARRRGSTVARPSPDGQRRERMRRLYSSRSRPRRPNRGSREEQERVDPTASERRDVSGQKRVCARRR